MLDIALAAFAVVALLLGLTCALILRNQRQQAKLHQEACNALELRLREVSRRLDAYLTGSIRMGEELHDLRRVVAPLPDKLSQMEQRDPSSFSFTQAARLVGMGASVDDLTQSCGLSRAEAELVSKLHQPPQTNNS